jgi:hypothetical protein
MKEAARLVAQTRGMKSGSVLLSHQVSLAVPSALRGLTSEFGMGSGGTLSKTPPKLVEVADPLAGLEPRPRRSTLLRDHLRNSFALLCGSPTVGSGR